MENWRFEEIKREECRTEYVVRIGYDLCTYTLTLFSGLPPLVEFVRRVSEEKDAQGKQRETSPPSKESPGAVKDE